MQIAARGKAGCSVVMAALLACSLVPMAPMHAAAYAAEGDTAVVGAAESCSAASDEGAGLTWPAAAGDDAPQKAGGSVRATGAEQASSDAQAGDVPALGAHADDASGDSAESPDAGEGGGTSTGADGDASIGDASAEDAAPENGAQLNPSNLADGTYTVAVSLRNASDLSQSSMAGGAIDATDKLSVQNGTYTLGLTLGTVQMGSITGYVKQVDAFPTFAVQDGKMQMTGEAAPAWTAKSQGDSGPAAFPVPESAKADGYAAIQLHSDEMPVSPQKAALFIDWSTLQKVSDEPTSFDGDASGAQTPAAPATETPAAQSAAQPAAAKEAFQVGHVYSVPIYFTKAGTTETSMAAQYFGGTAYVRPRSDGTFDVRFSTNRPDYVESVSYNGAAASVTSSSGSSREFCIRIPRATADTVVRLGFEIAPMKELGAGSVSGDMHLYLSRASDLGADTGQVTSSAGGGGSLPATGDPLQRAVLPLALGALASAGVALGTRRKAFGQNR